MKRRFCSIMLILCMTVCLLSCGKSDGNKGGADTTNNDNNNINNNSTDVEQSAAVNKYKDAPKVDMNINYIQDMEVIKNSFLSAGNTERMQNMLNKAASGEKITVGFIGGSITYGYKVNKSECFATLYSKWLELTFDVEVECVNAGISGTPSVLGNLRVDEEVLSHKPDLVVVEFAVNDGGEAVYKNSYESLIYRILKAENEPAVMLLFTITEEGHSCESWMSKIGEHYRLPMVSVVQSMMAEVKKGTYPYKQYSADGVHPNKTGHIWITEYLKYMTETIYKSDFEKVHYTIPDKAAGNRYYEAMILHNNTNTVPESLGSWEKTDRQNYFSDTFSHGWSYVPGGTNEELSFKANCRCVMIIYLDKPSSSSESWGAVDVFVDGEKKSVINACSQGGWDEPTYNVAYESVQAKEHIITIRAKEGCENKKFEILGIAWME
ncbi:MAG: SGNH/GDSL hydrolase family protein [Clostridiales bacterium]|nr:SGNH/GDSL hydrolase family protein [Clostridiales bacterium]